MLGARGARRKCFQLISAENICAFKNRCRSVVTMVKIPVNAAKDAIATMAAVIPEITIKDRRGK